jgi:di/tricarboxylate transporter
MMIVGVVFASAVGTVGMPFQAGVAATFGYLVSASEGVYSTYNYMQYLIFSIVMCAVSTALYFIICRIVVRPDLSRMKENVDVGNIKSFTVQQKYAIGALVALIVLTVLPSCLPTCGVKTFLSKFGTTAIVLLIISAVTFVRDKDGKPIFTFKQLADAGIFWNMVFMVGTAITMGGALSSAGTGFTTSLMNLFTPVFAGKSPVVFCIAICLITLVLTNIINNAVAGAIMVPVMYSFASQIGANPLMLTALICFVSDIGLMLPCASPSGAMLYSNKEWLATKDVVKYSLLGIIAMAITAICVGIPVGTLIFG